MPVPKATEGHGGGDNRLRDLIFRKIDMPDYMKLPDSHAGAMSCLTGIAIRNSIDQKKPIKIADLVRSCDAVSDVRLSDIRRSDLSSMLAARS